MKCFTTKLFLICFLTSLFLLVTAALRSAAATLHTSSLPHVSLAPSNSAAPPQASDTWPDGSGKQRFLQICGQCHPPDWVLGQNMDAAGWTEVITQMVSNGAQGSDADFNVILNYLVTNFGPAPAHVAINKATAGNLHAWLNIPVDQAQAIVDYRAKNGDFKSLDDVKKVPDVDAKLLDSIKDKLTYEPSGSSAGGTGDDNSGNVTPTQ